MKNGNGFLSLSHFITYIKSEESNTSIPKQTGGKTMDYVKGNMLIEPAINHSRGRHYAAYAAKLPKGSSEKDEKKKGGKSK